MCAFDPPGDLAELASYASRPAESLAQRIVATSLRFGVLCRFTAFVAVDTRIVNEDGELHKVIQPVEFPAGWAPQAPLAAGFGAMPTSLSAASAPAGDALMPGAAMGRQTRSMHIGGGAMPKLRRASQRDSGALETQRGESELAAASAQAAEEARRLEQSAASELQRRDALDDLATRLDALVRHLESRGVDAGALRSIIELLRDTTIASAQRWEQARHALTEFAAPATSGRPAFWKRA